MHFFYSLSLHLFVRYIFEMAAANPVDPVQAFSNRFDDEVNKGAELIKITIKMNDRKYHADTRKCRADTKKDHSFYYKDGGQYDFPYDEATIEVLWLFNGQVSIDSCSFNAVNSKNLESSLMNGGTLTKDIEYGDAFVVWRLLKQLESTALVNLRVGA